MKENCLSLNNSILILQRDKSTLIKNLSQSEQTEKILTNKINEVLCYL